MELELIQRFYRIFLRGLDMYSVAQELFLQQLLRLY